MIVLELLLGLVLGGVGMWLVLDRRHAGLINQAEMNSATACQEAESARAEAERLRSEAGSAAEYRERAGRLEERVKAEGEKTAWLDDAKTKMELVVSGLSAEALRANSGEFLKQADDRVRALVTPLEQALGNLQNNVQALEVKREGAYSSMDGELRKIAESHGALDGVTSRLVRALTATGPVGQWGQARLRKLVEMAGLLPRVEFREQKPGESGTPDMLIFLPNDGVVVVDAKAQVIPIDEAAQATPEGWAKDCKVYAAKVKDTMIKLTRKEYTAEFSEKLRFIIMFIPSEASLRAALEGDPELWEYANSQNVILAAPHSMLPLLRVIAAGWMERQTAENAVKIRESAGVLYERVVKFLSLMTTLGERLKTSVDGYNEAIGSLGTRVLPSARKMKQLGVDGKDLVEPVTVDLEVEALDVRETRGEAGEA